MRRSSARKVRISDTQPVDFKDGFWPKMDRHSSVSGFDGQNLDSFSRRNFGPEKNQGRFPTKCRHFGPRTIWVPKIGPKNIKLD